MSSQELQRSLVAADGVESLRAVARALLERNAQLERALQSRILIEQAKGILAERAGLDMEGAFSWLRKHARDHNLLLVDVAQSIIEGKLAPQPPVAGRSSSL